MDALTGWFRRPRASDDRVDDQPPAAQSAASHCELSQPGIRVVISGPDERFVRVQRPDATILLVGAAYATGSSGTFGTNDLQTFLSAFRPAHNESLDALSGEFALLCYEPAPHRLTLATDRFGTRPLYFCESGGTLWFGTDLQWVSHVSGHRELSFQAIYDYLFFSVVPGHQCIYKGIRKVPAASTATFQPRAAAVRRYWLPDFSRSPAQPVAALRANTFEAISTAVKRHVAQPHLGGFLSGGLDSSTVCGFAARHLGRPLPVFTIGYDIPDYDERTYARLAASHFGLSLHEAVVSSADVASSLQRVVGGFAEPFGNASVIAAYLCAKYASQAGVRHMLAGDGGDELFAGNSRYREQMLLEFYQRIPDFARRLLIDPTARLTRSATGTVRKVARYVERARIPLPDRLFGYNLLVRNAPDSVLTSPFLREIDTESPYRYVRQLFAEPRNGDVLDRMLYLDWTLTLTDNDLPKVRVATDLAGLTAHFPMLDADVVATSVAVPTDAKLTLRSLRKFYKQTFSEFLPQGVLRKKKHGFGVPVGPWMQTDAALRGRIHAQLLSLARREIVRLDFIERLIRLQATDHAIYYGDLVWILFMLEEWLQRMEQAT